MFADIKSDGQKRAIGRAAALMLLEFLDERRTRLVTGDCDDERFHRHAAIGILRFGRTDIVKAQIAPYKYPREIDFLGALPKTATGKIQRFALRHRETRS